MRGKLRNISLFLSLFYLTFYIPMALTFYLPWWMELSCAWNDRCEIVGMEKSLKGINELSSYFRHQDQGLESFFTEKEKLHLKEVRGIFDTMLMIALAAVILLAVSWDRTRLPRYSIYNAFIILALLLVLPFFGTFWKDVFHPLLFDNDLWKNNRADLSYYIMPRQFFKYTVALIIIACYSINMLIWYFTRTR